MKKFLALLFFSTMFFQSYSIGDICRVRSNGNFNVFFKVITWTNGLIAVTGESCLHCYSPGLKRCIPDNAGGYPADYDNVDKENARVIFDYIDQQVESRNFEGSYQVVVQVEGEVFKRVYTGTWSLGEKGEGMDRFTRVDIPN